MRRVIEFVGDGVCVQEQIVVRRRSSWRTCWSHAAVRGCVGWTWRQAAALSTTLSTRPSGTVNWCRSLSASDTDTPLSSGSYSESSSSQTLTNHSALSAASRVTTSCKREWRYAPATVRLTGRGSPGLRVLTVQARVTLRTGNGTTDRAWITGVEGIDCW